MQYNNSGSLSGNIDWSFNQENNLSGSTPILFNAGTGSAITSSQSSSAASIYGQNSAGHSRLYGYSGRNLGNLAKDDLFNSLLGKFTFAIYPGASASPGFTSLGLAVAVTGNNLGAPTPQPGTTRTAAKAQQLTTLSGNNAMMGIQDDTVSMVWRGNAVNLGGFYISYRFANWTEASGSRAFIGLLTGSLLASPPQPGVGNSNPTLWTNAIGMGYESSDPISNGWYIISVDENGLNTKVQISSSASGTAVRDGDTVYELHMYAPQNGAFIGLKVLNVSSGTILYQNPIFSGNLPGTGIFLSPTLQWGTGSSGVQLTASIMHVIGQSYV